MQDTIVSERAVRDALSRLAELDEYHEGLARATETLTLFENLNLKEGMQLGPFSDALTASATRARRDLEEVRKQLQAIHENLRSACPSIQKIDADAADRLRQEEVA